MPVATCGSCISRRVERDSGCGPPASSLPGGKAAAKPATQAARSRTQLNTPPMGANAPYGAGSIRAHPLPSRRCPAASSAGRNSAASKPVRVIPSGASSRDRMKSAYGVPDTAEMTRPRIA